MNPKIEKLTVPIRIFWQRLPGPVRNFVRAHRQLFVSIVILTVAVFIYLILFSLREPPPKDDTVVLAPLVEVKQLQKQDIPMIVTGYGTVRAKVEVEIAPQVSGKVVSINPQFKAGGFIPAGQEILKIDPRDYKLAVQQAQAGVADAQVKLDLEKAEAAVALDEWRQLHPGTEPDSPLVLREPQIRQARALLDSAKAALATAKLSLERTGVTLPLDVRIVSESADLGQFCSAGQSIGRAYGVEAVEIEVPLEDKELRWFNIPDEEVSFNGNDKSSKGSEVLVKATFAGTEHTWKGFVARTTGQVDAKSRLISVVVEVPNPFGGPYSKAPLLPGLFVEARIKGNTLKDVFAVPRDAIRGSDEVWMVNNSKLHVSRLNIIRADKGFVYVTEGLKDEDLIVTSSLDAVVDGMAVRVKE
jgi:RND family efflux transporter MFP subunit